MPNGEMETNLVRECDNHDVPDYDYRTCEHNTYMCCWTENDGQGMADNTVSTFAGLAILRMPRVLLATLGMRYWMGVRVSFDYDCRH